MAGKDRPRRQGMGGGRAIILSFYKLFTIFLKSFIITAVRQTLMPGSLFFEEICKMPDVATRNAGHDFYKFLDRSEIKNIIVY